MAIDCAEFEFTANTSTGVQTIVSGLSFTPKAYMLICSQTTSDGAFAAHHLLAVGFSDGTTSRNCCIASEDAQATSDAGRTFGSEVLRLPLITAPDTSYDAVAAHSSFGSGTIEINWTDAPASAWKIKGICWGGADISAAVKEYAMGTTSTGNADYTGVAFQPEAIITLCPEDNSASPLIKAHGALGIGMGVSSTKRCLCSWVSEDAQTTMDTWGYSSSQKVVGCLRDTTGASTGRALGDLDSFLSDGVRINWINAPHDSTNKFFALFLAGGDWDLLKIAKRTSTGTTTLSPSVNTIKGMVMLSNCLQDDNSTSVAHARASMGLCSSTSAQSGLWTGDKDAAADSATAHRTETGKILIMATENATHGSSTVEAVADISAMSTTATLNYTTCTTLAADLYFLFCGEVTSTLFTRSITESTISVSDSNARTLYANRALSESSISVSDSNARQLKANRAIGESSISVSDTLAGNKFNTRSINESAISVSDAVARQLKANRALAESSISVSEAVARILYANRALSESSISVSDSNTRTRIVPRTITESTINVSDALARTTFHFRTRTESTINVSDTLTGFKLFTRVLTEPSISVSDSVARSRKSFTVITEPTISVSDLLVGIVPVFVPAAYITDPGYMNPLRFRVTWKSKLGDTTADESGDQIIYYRYDSYVPEDRPFDITDFSIRLTQGEISTATLTIQDFRELIDDPRKISKKAIVEVDFKKELGREWQRILTGFVREIKTLRPAHEALGYQITIKSKQAIYLERITNFKRAAKRGAVDSTEGLTTDANMATNKLFKEVHTATNIFPRKKSPTIQQTGEFDLETGSISDDVTDFITEIAPGLTTAADVLNQLTEGTGSIWGVDEYGNPYLRYPTEKHSGIILKDSPLDTDSALNTSVNMTAFQFTDTTDIVEGFANRIYVLNSKDTKSTASSSKASGFTTLSTRWIAQSFIADDNNVTSAAFILSKTGNPTNTAGTIKGVLRASSANGNFPTGATLATFEISFSSLSNSKETIFVNDIKTKDGVITVGSKYWWVLQGTGLFDDTHTVNWHHDNDLVTTGRPGSAVLPLVDTDPTKPGNQFNWVPNPNGPVYSFSTFSSINHVLVQSDFESIKENGLIEAVVNLPAFDDDATYRKVLVKILKYSAKEKRIFEYAKVTIPTAKLFKPGELLTVVDSKSKLDYAKSINAEIVEVSYNFDVNSNALGCKYVDLRLIGFIDHTLNDYLENKEC